MRRRTGSLIYALICLFAVASFSPAADNEQAAEQRTLVLDSTGFWRLHHTLTPPVIEADDGLKPVLIGRRCLNEKTPPPPADWMKPEFDDGAWLRGPALLACKTPYLTRLCLRGKFAVTDPARVNGLSLSLAYHGGAVVYVNGAEVARGHLAAAPPGGAEVAEGYSEEAFVSEKGVVLGDRIDRTADTARRLSLRTRTLADVAIPQGLLRKGVNVLAIEIVRAPYHKVLEEKKTVEGKSSRYELAWNTCEIRRIQLAAADPAGLVPNASRPEGLQVWNQNLLASDFDLDFGDPNEPVRPVTIAAARNGSFSGKVVVGSSKPLRGLQAIVSDLKAGAPAISASRIRVRYGLPWGNEHLVIPYSSEVQPYPAAASLLGCLAEAPLDEFPVSGKSVKPSSGKPVPVFGAVVPIWLTANVPAEANPGVYTGSLTIRADGEEPVSVPVELSVADWALPDPQNYRTWVEMIQSPDTLAMEYGLDLWSPKHFEMMAASMKFLNEIGSRVVYVPLIAQTNSGNEQSMVRWVKKADGRYEHDFSVMEKYLDLAEKHMGRPKIVIFDVWELYIIQKEKYDTSKEGQQTRAIQHLEQRKALQGTGPVVTVVDPVAGTCENVCLPAYSDPSSRPLWAPLFEELRSRMHRRGLDGAIMLGTASDAVPTREEVQFFKDLTADLPWVVHSHHGGNHLYNLAKVAYQTRVWNISFADGDPAKNRAYGWRRPELLADYERHGDINSLSPTYWRHLPEFNISGDQRGIGRLGADFWPVIRDKEGRRKSTVGARYPQSSRRNLDLYSSVLAPGPGGPVATTRYELLREGVQECEARIFIERALTDKDLKEKLGADLAERCQLALDERLLWAFKGVNHLQLSGPSWFYASWRGMKGVAGHTWFVGSSWQQRTRLLYDLAAEVGKKVGVDVAETDSVPPARGLTR